MKRLFIIVEGQSEKEFVQSTLRTYLSTFGIDEVRAIMIQTSKGHKGGFVRYEHLKNDALKLLKQQKDIIVTTFVDYYKIPNSIPRFKELQAINNPIDRAREMESAIFNDINDLRFYPYIQLFEFETLLFSSLSAYKLSFSDRPKILKEIENIIDTYPNPEEINDGIDTSPANRLIKIIPDYSKVIYGNIIASDIGIETIISKCPRFNNWLETIIEKVKE